jgi:hypothetical protein
MPLLRELQELNFTSRLYDLVYQGSLGYCHPERSEGSRSQILRFAHQNDTCVKVILSQAVSDDIWPTVIAFKGGNFGDFYRFAEWRS